SLAGDVYAVGALMYEVLVGLPLERGGSRPSEAMQGGTPEIDEIVARACHSNPDKRYGHVDVPGEAIAESPGKGIEPPPRLASEPAPRTSLAMAIAEAAEGSPTALAASGNAVIDRALAAALADTTEKWLISKGRLDYGPFSLAEVVAQIDKGEIVAG